MTEAEQLETNRALYDDPRVRARLIRRHAARIRPRATWIDRADLEGAGQIGFENALRKFTPQRDNANFEAFASRCVRNAMIAEANRLLPRSLQDLYKKIYEAERDAMAEHGRVGPPTMEETAKKAGVDVAEVDAARRAFAVLAVDQLPVQEDGSDSEEIASGIWSAPKTDEDEPSPSGCVVGEEVVDAYRDLSESDKSILTQGWSTEDSNQMTAKEKVKLSRARQKLFDATIRNVFNAKLTGDEINGLTERYREGRYRTMPATHERAAFVTLRGRLREIDLLKRLFPGHSLRIVTGIFNGVPMNEVAAAVEWTANRGFSDEFTRMRPLVGAVDSLEKRDEPRHAFTTRQHEAAADIDAISSDVVDVLETLRWLLSYARYSSDLGNQRIATPGDIELLEHLHQQRVAPTPDEKAKLHRLFQRAFGITTKGIQ